MSKTSSVSQSISHKPPLERQDNIAAKLVGLDAIIQTLRAARTAVVPEADRRPATRVSSQKRPSERTQKAKPKDKQESGPRVPSYRRHRASGQAIVTLPDGQGGRRDVLLGRYKSKASREAYAAAVAAWEMAGRRLPCADEQRRPDMSVNELVERFVVHAEKHYRRPDGTATNELFDYKRTLKYMRVLYGTTPAADFGPLRLKAVREAMIRDDLCRGVINQRFGRIKRMFKWAVAEELVPHAVYAALATVAGLGRGRTAARETQPVRPVPEAFVRATLPHVLPPVAAMIELQLLTGCRPGEACAMRACDIDTSGTVWLYKPPAHKMSYRGGERVISLGPKAQAIVKSFLTMDMQAHLFSPARALAERAVSLRANRKTKVQPSQQDRRKKSPKRTPHEAYNVTAYGRAISRACDAAGVAHWHPNQLRHNHATLVRKQYGLEAAGAALGHAKMSATQVYAERDAALAQRVAAEIG